MSHDLVAVQRDAALLDALARRSWSECDLPGAVDPLAGLLAALGADVDEGLLEVARPEVEPLGGLIPQQGGHRARPGTISSLPMPPPGRRHVARAVAAMVVTAAVLSVSGVAAAVTGDPLTPYKRVIDVVRGGYDQVVPKGLVPPAPTDVPPLVPATAKGVAPKAAAAVEQVREAVGTRASRAADGRRLWDRNVARRTGPARTGSGKADGARHGWGRHDRVSHGTDGRQGGSSASSSTRSGHDTGGQDRTAYGDGGGSGHYGHYARDSGQHRDQSGDSRR
jgi:hypothetical protein